ncbi:MAG TPA: hypothetical protein VG013_31065, partial [Gemmataceae bacterium]|nr:hypothetical protein [Gemmataceae bacterium]
MITCLSHNSTGVEEQLDETEQAPLFDTGRACLSHWADDAESTTPSLDAAWARPPSEVAVTVAPGDEFADRRISERIRAIEPGWSPTRLHAYIQDLLFSMSCSVCLTETALNEYLGWLTKQLKKQGYTPLTPSKYLDWLRLVAMNQDGQSKKPRPLEPNEAPGSPGLYAPRGRFQITDSSTEFLGDQPEAWGTRDMEKHELIANFSLVFDKDVERQDDFQSRRFFEGRLTLLGQEAPFRIAAEDFADNNKFKAALYAAGGPKLQVYCRIDLLRQAVSELTAQGQLARRTCTTNFGWAEGADAFLCPGGRVTASGFEPAGEGSEMRVDLEDEEQARHLDLRPVPPEALRALKQHIVNDLLRIHERRITYSLLGTVAAALLYRFSHGVGRYALWLTGPTGSGKSFAAKL